MRNNRIRLFSVGLLVFLGIIPAFGQEKAVFDRIVNFSVTLKELHLSLQEGGTAEMERGRFVLLSGTLSDVEPKLKRPRFYLLKEADIIDPKHFILTIRETGGTLAALVKRGLSDQSADFLEAYNPAKDKASSILKPLLKDLNELIQKGPLYDKQVFDSIGLDPDLMSIVRLNPTAEDSEFLNRLLLEAGFPEDIKPVTVRGEIITGEWLGMEEIRSYHGLVDFQGTAAYMLFIRRKPDTATELMITLNSRILVTAELVEPVESFRGKIWLSKALYVRKLR
jgi:hypothetical protein